jgi:branched-chain amino acid transport system permease protein
VIRAYGVARRGLLIGLLVVAALVPALFGTYVTSAIGLQTMWVGLCAASLTFLASYGGMVSLAQVGLFGVAGLVTAALSVNVGIDPWLSAFIAIGIATAVGVVFGALASSSTGVYFLMITLALALITYYLFAAVPAFGQHEGINQVYPPDILGDPVLQPTTIYYFILGVCVLAYLGLRYLVRTPFGIAFQGVRDDPLRMMALGYNVRLYRTLAFAFAATIAATAGVFSAWTNTRISAGSISLTVTIEVLTAAVIGGLFRLEGAWVGALIVTVLTIYGPAYTDRYGTVIGAIFLIVVLLSPGGIVGIASSIDERVRGWLGRRAGPPRPEPESTTQPKPAGPSTGPASEA